MVAQHAELVRLVCLIGLIGLALSACAALSGPVATPTQPSSESDAGTQPLTRISATAVLLEQSRAERSAGTYAEATASIERALRIEPNNALLWIELGEIKLADGDAEQAEMIARKALTLAGNDRSIESRAFLLINR